MVYWLIYAFRFVCSMCHSKVHTPNWHPVKFVTRWNRAAYICICKSFIHLRIHLHMHLAINSLTNLIILFTFRYCCFILSFEDIEIVANASFVILYILYTYRYICISIWFIFRVFLSVNRWAHHLGTQLHLFFVVRLKFYESLFWNV